MECELKNKDSSSINVRSSNGIENTFCNMKRSVEKTYMRTDTEAENKKLKFNNHDSSLAITSKDDLQKLDLDSEQQKNNDYSLCTKLKSALNNVSDESIKQVFIWDLDETIIVFHSLLTGVYADRNFKNRTETVQLGYEMEDFIFTLAETYLFFDEIEDCDQVNINDLIGEDDGRDLTSYEFSKDNFVHDLKDESFIQINDETSICNWKQKLAFRYRKVRDIYNSNKNNMTGLLGSNKENELNKLLYEINVATNNWLEIAIKCLHHINSKPGCLNILVTTTQLIPAIAKVLLFRLGDIFDIENIYSARNIGKVNCFKRVMSRFQNDCSCVVIGDGMEEETAAKQLKYPFWKILNHDDLTTFSTSLNDNFFNI